MTESMPFSYIMIAGSVCSMMTEVCARGNIDIGAPDNQPAYNSLSFVFCTASPSPMLSKTICDLISGSSDRIRLDPTAAPWHLLIDFDLSPVGGTLRHPPPPFCPYKI